ncbi:S8 family serine peptidase [Stenotrophomonas maltophilia]|uniref:S8 family serine peptidase n=1 Tax=Stenotrophomonas maltophilia TaxID=40324 RepID=UPI001CB7DF9F|nr:DNA breaking-rejoining protein [Stenotrophomonas maltophilia]
MDAELLRAAAWGRSFEIGSSSFRLAPPATVQKVNSGQFKIEPVEARELRALGTRSTTATAARSDSGAGKFAAAVSKDGTPLVVTARVNVYFTDASSVRAAATATGGTVVKVTKASGRGIVEYPSVNAALDATTKLLSTAGIRAVEPNVVQWEESK